MWDECFLCNGQTWRCLFFAIWLFVIIKSTVVTHDAIFRKIEIFPRIYTLEISNIPLKLYYLNSVLYFYRTPVLTFSIDVVFILSIWHISASQHVKKLYLGWYFYLTFTFCIVYKTLKDIEKAINLMYSTLKSFVKCRKICKKLYESNKSWSSWGSPNASPSPNSIYIKIYSSIASATVKYES